MTTSQLNNGFVRLTPDEGKSLYNHFTDRHYSEAIVKENKIGNFYETEN